MAAVAVPRRLMVFLFRLVALVTVRFRVDALERKVGFFVVEGVFVQQNDVCIPAFMLGVTMFTLRLYRPGQATMESGFVVDVIENVLMIVAVHTQMTLSFFIGCVMAFVTLLFKFFMGLDDRPGH